MNKQQTTKMINNLLTLPENAGRSIVEFEAMLACPLLGTSKFIKFCRERGLSIDGERLIRLERLGIFSPVFRVKTPNEKYLPFYIPIRHDNNWFNKNWAFDTTSIHTSYKVPDYNDKDHEAYYSVFQIYHLDSVLSGMTFSLQMDFYLDGDKSVDWQKKGNEWIECAKSSLEDMITHEYRRSVALLCQFISNRYYPNTQGNKRTINIGGCHYSDNWISVGSLNWNWHKETNKWNPQLAKKLFDITPDKLRHAYNGLAVSQENCDPLAKWHQLTQFINIAERKKLKNDALKAETLRAGANMLRLLYKNLYDEELPIPNEVTGTVMTHFPELSVRNDPRRYLEFVTNRYGINPQPKLSLIVEGQSEEVAIQKIFENYFGVNEGTYGIEIIVLGGVDVATGSKRMDRFRAIFRLIDYLHHY